ncbi:MAG: O-antigen ligase family protein [Clostridia bacterium]
MVNGKIAVLQAFPMYLFYATIFVISYLVIKDKDFSKIFYTFSCMMIIMCVMTLIDKEGTIIYPFINHNSPYAGMFVNSNHFAYLLSMGILISACLFIFKKDIFMKTFYLISFALQVYTLNLNNTLGSFVAVILGLFMLSLLYAIKYRKFSLELIVVIMTFCACCMLALEKNMIIQIKDVVFDIFKVFGSIFGDVGGDVSGAGTNRWGLWLAAMQNMINYPIFGTGIDCYRFATPATSLMPHNEFLQIGSETGFIGIGLYLSALIILCVKYFKKLIKMNDNTFVVGIVVFTYLVSACFGNTMPHTFPYYMIFIGMLAYSLNKKEEYNQIS